MKKIFIKFINWIEVNGNKLPSTATIFFYLAISIIALSFIFSLFGLSANYNSLDSEGNLVENTVVVKSLLSADGINFMTTSLVSNFKNFYALTVVLTIMLMISIAQGSGLLDVLIHKIAIKTPANLITPVVAFLGVMLSIASSTGYVVLVPLAAILYKSANRNPIAGIAVAFAGTSAGWGANLLIAANDPVLADITEKAARYIDPTYTVDATANWYAAAASVFVIVGVITFVEKYITSKNLSTIENLDKEVEKVEKLTELQERGLKFSGIFSSVYIIVIVGLIISGLNGGVGSFLLAPETNSIVGSPFLKSIITYIGLLFVISGLSYGYFAKTIKSEKDVVAMMENAMRDLAPFIVIIFFAAQFTAYFNYTNLGTIISAYGVIFLESIGLTGIGSLVLFLVISGFLNLFMAVDSAKWVILAPVFVPMFMQLGFSPELTQMFYRIGDSSTNIIAPLMPFFPYVLAIMKKYDKKAGMGTLIATMLPYTICIMIVWTIFIVIWYFLGIPLGPDALLHYNVQ